jgi:hypothetical protein
MNNVTDINDTLAANFLLIEVSIKSWQATKSDKNLARKTAADNGADSNSVAASRRIMSGADTELKAVKSAQQAVRGYLYSSSVPWSSSTDGDLKGPRMVSVTESLKVIKNLKKLQGEFTTALNDFKAVYVQRVAEAINRLGPLANPADYPSVDELDKAFNVTIDISPVPSRSSFENMALPAELSTALANRLAKRHSVQVENAMRDLTSRLTGYVDNMATTLARHASGEKTRLYESLVENVRNTATVLKGSNLTNDPRLTAVASKLDDLTCHDIKALKTSVATADTVAKKAAIVTKELEDIMSDVFM